MNTQRKQKLKKAITARNPKSNWRFRGLLAAQLHRGSQEAWNHLASYWPTNQADYRFLSQWQRDNPALSPDRKMVPRKLGEGNEDLLEYFEDDAAEKLQRGELNRDQYIKRCLLSTSNEELDVLFREELLQTVIEGARDKQWARDAVTVIPVDRRVGDLPRGSAHVYAERGAEGAATPMDSEDYDTVAYTCDKIHQGALITEELIDQAEPDVLERQIRFTGSACENAVNREMLLTLLEDANQEHDTAGSNQDVTMVNEAIALVENQEFGDANTLIAHTEFLTDLFDDSNLAYANQAGTDTVIRQRQYNPILGLDIFRASDGTYNGADASRTTYTYGFNTDAEIGAAVFNNDFAAIVMYKDLETKDFDDPIRDLVGMKAKMWADTKLLQTDAAARIEY